MCCNGFGSLSLSHHVYMAVLTPQRSRTREKAGPCALGADTATGWSHPARHRHIESHLWLGTGLAAEYSAWVACVEIPGGSDGVASIMNIFLRTGHKQY